MAININREVEDTFYRYKMPRLQAKVEGKGNGIKTVIVNVSDIARALYRKPIYVTKYFGCELGAQVNVDEKNERYIVNGAHDAEKLQQLLDGFIKKFVLCPNCNNPETDISVKKKSEIVKATCKACGATKTLDPQHRLTQYIMKNPPDESDIKKPTTKPPAAKQQGSDEDQEDDPVDTSTIEVDEDDWGEDASEEAQRKRQEELTARVKSLAMSVDVEKSKKERAQMFFTLLSNHAAKGELMARQEELAEEADRLDLGSRSVLVLTEVILKDPNTVVKVFSDHAALYRRLIRVSGDAEKSQLNLLNGLVTLVNQYPEMMKKVALLVKSMYDKDVCEEEVILKWADKPPSSKFGPKKVHEQLLAKCKVFTDWLRQAEEEDDDDDSDEDQPEENVAPAKPAAAAKANNAAKPVPQAADDDDDFDIDAI